MTWLLEIFNHGAISIDVELNVCFNEAAKYVVAQANKYSNRQQEQGKPETRDQSLASFHKQWKVELVRKIPI